MDALRWERIQALFHEAADLPRDAQRAFLEARCGDDPGLLPRCWRCSRRTPGATRCSTDRSAGRGEGPGRKAGTLPTRQIGPYRLIRVLGEGGMGVVYLAERTDLGSLVAIKILRDAWLSPARRERFASEQRTLAQLNHPAIARLYDADTLTDGTPWFAMEYVDGRPAHRVLRGPRALDSADCSRCSAPFARPCCTPISTR